ncbi:flagellar hook-associated protein FlgL [Planomicrobium sp. CPCC 101110]|uniref:flagellar hook-associated protein FlgL n=1 Tax=Planomicrobium sp. CPCC 101110 TaxID=2599619 RepID=UPI0011B63DAD|nr:flagellar hook-associated protein FlgL [Planomicrobium sp. CPCC 101110]TWT27819.1 flagellar hook-associated protein FlgL [Planomicrobium sp. CPCC 101110]
MRVTQQMMHQNSVRQMNQNLSRFEKLNNQVASGKTLSRPSDNPNGISKAMNLKSTIAANEQFERNVDEAKLWLDESDQTINQVVNVMQRARELAVKGANDTLSQSDREAIAIEVEQLNEQVRQFANTKVNDNYLFNGTKTDQAPFPNPDSYLTNSFDNSEKLITIGENVTVKVNITADQMFGNIEDEGNLFKTLSDLANGLRTGENTVSLETIDKSIDRLLGAAAEVGARTNRVESIENRIQDSMLDLKARLSKIEDIDYAEAIIKLKSEESVYQASLASSAKIIQPSLMDFLR